LRERIAELDPGEAVDDLAERVALLIAGSAPGGERDRPRMAVYQL
jgi:hypothetical protein